MTGGQIAALIFAILLLLPGGCFLIVGIGLASDRYYAGMAVLPIGIALVILGIAGVLFWAALRRKRPPPMPPRNA